MNIDPYDSKPLFLQIQEGLEIGILTGVYPEESRVPSTTELSEMYQINPATALKGVNALVDMDVLYKKRGVGVFVREGAVDMLRKSREENFHTDYLLPMLREAKRLGYTREDVLALIGKGMDDGTN